MASTVIDTEIFVEPEFRPEFAGHVDVPIYAVPKELLSFTPPSHFRTYSSGLTVRSLFLSVPLEASEHKMMKEFIEYCERRGALIPYETESFLTRLVIYHEKKGKCNHDKAFDQLKEIINWRISYFPLRQAMIERILHEGVVYLAGRDKMFRPLMCMRFDRLPNEWRQNPHWVTQVTVWAMEMAIHHIFLAGVVESMSIIIDLENVPAATTPLGAMKEIIATFSKQYPFRLHSMMVVNAPWAVSMLYSVVKTFMTAAQQEKTKILGKKEILQEIRSNFHPGQVECMYGGVRKPLTTFYPYQMLPGPFDPLPESAYVSMKTNTALVKWNGSVAESEYNVNAVLTDTPEHREIVRVAQLTPEQALAEGVNGDPGNLRRVFTNSGMKGVTCYPQGTQARMGYSSLAAGLFRQLNMEPPTDALLAEEVGSIHSEGSENFVWPEQLLERAALPTIGEDEKAQLLKDVRMASEVAAVSPDAADAVPDGGDHMLKLMALDRRRGKQSLLMIDIAQAARAESSAASDYHDDSSRVGSVYGEDEDEDYDDEDDEDEEDVLPATVLDQEGGCPLCAAREGRSKELGEQFHVRRGSVVSYGGVCEACDKMRKENPGMPLPALMLKTSSKSRLNLKSGNSSARKNASANSASGSPIPKAKSKQKLNGSAKADSSFALLPPLSAPLENSTNTSSPTPVSPNTPFSVLDTTHVNLAIGVVQSFLSKNASRSAGPPSEGRLELDDGVDSLPSDVESNAESETIKRLIRLNEKRPNAPMSPNRGAQNLSPKSAKLPPYLNKDGTKRLRVSVPILVPVPGQEQGRRGLKIITTNLRPQRTISSSAATPVAAESLRNTNANLTTAFAGAFVDVTPTPDMNGADAPMPAKKPRYSTFHRFRGWRARRRERKAAKKEAKMLEKEEKLRAKNSPVAATAPTADEDGNVAVVAVEGGAANPEQQEYLERERRIKRWVRRFRRRGNTLYDNPSKQRKHKNKDEQGGGCCKSRCVIM